MEEIEELAVDAAQMAG